ncbi:CBS domain-containing protein [Ktedonosporobacter rubrisoli]|uniref:CBS domain-containing protein n=1 Tax=Ktedonosporobacter rubrisoli TaxID=2509675 RepID=A0A4P6JS72_KTERU|nr:CBS domain-containing protein [Ktedonosporobacter rubrisoli]QBD78175.1 CBS domain-containing protein [Ktedonosporobacter rubrisoli]
MIVRDIMTTKLITVAPDDTLAHAVNLLRQHQFHHLPVVRTVTLTEAEQPGSGGRQTAALLEGLLTSQDVDLLATVARQSSSGDLLQRHWQERRIVEVMHRALIRVTPTTNVAAAAQLLVERGLNYLPVVEYTHVEQDNQPVLVGLITSSDLLLAFARAMGAYEPGMQLDVALPMGDTAPLGKVLLSAAELNVQIRSIIVVPVAGGVPLVASVRLGTINPTPLLVRLQEEGIQYTFGAPLDGDKETI